MERTKYGARLRPALPVTIDSMMAVERSSLESEELEPGRWYIARPKTAYGPRWMRIYHAWLVLTNRAMAVQFMADHLALAARGRDSGDA